MTDQSLRILAFGAHPDDCDVVAGGTAALYRSLGHQVKFVSVTNGESGHHKISGDELVRIRKQGGNTESGRTPPYGKQRSWQADKERP